MDVIPWSNRKWINMVNFLECTMLALYCGHHGGLETSHDCVVLVLDWMSHCRFQRERQGTDDFDDQGQDQAYEKQLLSLYVFE